MKPKFTRCSSFRGSLHSLSLMVMLAVSLAAILQSCDKPDPGPSCKFVKTKYVSADMFMKWNAQIQKAYTHTPDEGFPPPMISRWFAIYHVAMFDALNSVQPLYKTFASNVVNRDADPNATLVQAVYDVLVAIGPQEGAARISIDSLFEVSMSSIAGSAAKEAGITLGKSVAAAVLAKRQPDAPYTAVVGFVPTPPSGVNPGEYRHLPPLGYALAGFHKMTPWVLKSGDQFPVDERPYAVNTPEYTADYNEIKELGELNSATRTADQRALGIFWAENTSRGWNAIARQILDRKGISLDAWQAASLFTLLHVTIADGYISVFDAKSRFYYWRPITAVHEGDTDGNIETVGRADWQPTLPTPGVPEYPSAHALTGAAAGQVLIRFFKTDKVSFSTTSGYFPGERSFRSIREAVRESSLSRIYIGYHFRRAVDVGEKEGYELGDYIFKNALVKNPSGPCKD